MAGDHVTSDPRTIDSMTVHEDTESLLSSGSLPQVPRASLSDHRWKVLVVDDDVMVRKVSARMLEESDVLTAGNGSEAVKVLEEQGEERIDCVLLDMKMPGLTFEESFAGIRRVRPDLPVVACSGNGREALEEDFANARGTGFLGKPFTRKELKDALGRLIPAPAS